LSPPVFTRILATSALDAESETLVNSALAALLRDNNTTISIAHRLSTIKRSDLLIVLSSEGKVAEQGTYKELSSKPNGAFTKLMEWQMSGGDAEERSTPAFSPGSRGPPSEAEELQHRLGDRQEGEHDVDEEGLKVRKEKESVPEVVLDKTQRHEG